MGRLALAALALISCAHSAPVGTCRDVNDRCIGRAIDMVMMAAVWTEVDDREIGKYVSAVGQRLLHAAGRNERWTFRVIDVAEPNGQANLDNTVYVTRGALVRLRSEAELAGLLGHEIGHILSGHGHEAFAEAMREVARSDGDRAMRAARDDEIQADELAVLLAWRAGYDPRAVETMLRAVAQGDPRMEPDADDPHPGWIERLARVHAFAAQLPGGELGEQRYIAAIALLAVGDDPRQAFVLRNHVAVLARVGLAFELPSGTQMELDGAAIGIAVGDTNVRVEEVKPELARYIDTKRDGDRIAWLERGPHGLAVIIVQGPHVTSVAEQIRRAKRAPRPDELAKIQPHRTDFAARRKLWPEI